MATVSLPRPKPVPARLWFWVLGFAALVSAYVWAIEAPPFLLVGAESYELTGRYAALWLSVVATHEPKSLYVATGTLAVFWLAAAGMAYRAIRNRRVEQHREWMIRSYVLTLTFIACRLANHLPLFPELGPERVSAQIWLFWVVPVLATEYVLQWRRGARA